MKTENVIDQLENALSYSEHCPGGRWELDILKEAVTAALVHLAPDSAFLAGGEPA